MVKRNRPVHWFKDTFHNPERVEGNKRFKLQPFVTYESLPEVKSRFIPMFNAEDYRKVEAAMPEPEVTGMHRKYQLRAKTVNIIDFYSMLGHSAYCRTHFMSQEEQEQIQDIPDMVYDITQNMFLLPGEYARTVWDIAVEVEEHKQRKRTALMCLLQRKVLPTEVIRHILSF